MRRGIATAAILATATLTAACNSSSSGHGTTGDNPVISPSSTTASSTSSTPAPTSTSSSPSPSPSPSRSSSSPASTSPTATGPAACSSEQLHISLLRGGATPHQQLAALVFTNTSATACTLRGYPGAQLVQNGHVIGIPAGHQPAVTPTVTLASGGSAQATLTASTGCQAPLSDHVRVSAPGQSSTVDVADTLRDCTVTVGPVGPAS